MVPAIIIRMDAVIRKVIEAGICAPSGENSQPWRFRPEGMSIRLFDAPESDRSLYNFEGRGTLVAHGAAIENMVITGNAEGYVTEVQLFPDNNNPHCIALLRLTKQSKQMKGVELARYVPLRTTNRKPYRGDALKPDAVQAIEEAARAHASGATLTRVLDRPNMARLSHVGATNERIMLGNKELHEFFFTHLTWTSEEDGRKRRGFFIKTLELPAPVQVLFRLFAHWPVMAVLKRIGFPVLVGKGNAATYAASAELGIITIPSEEREDFIQAGRLFERIWLSAAAHNVSFQPLTGTIFMGFFTKHVNRGHFSKGERALIMEQLQALADTVGSKGVPALMYRLGYAEPPTARARRFDFDSFLV